MNERAVIAAVLLCLSLWGCASRDSALTILATTTSVANSSLLDRLLTRYGERVRTVPVGSGLALQLLASSRADVAITHAPEREAAALQTHPHWWYRKILYNEFLLVGPPEDLARVADSADVSSAMRRIAASGVTFNEPARRFAECGR